MWEVYGKRGPAIRISVDADAFCQHVKAHGHHIAFGRVTYAGQTSMVRPQFLAKQDLTDDEDATYHLFFHKHSFYSWEDEFRVVLLSKNEATIIPVADNLVESVIISPFGLLSPTLEQSLRDRFGEHVHNSTLTPPYH